MRLFVALELPDHVRSELVKAQKDIRSSGLFTRNYTAPENLHLTLMFLGDVDQEGLEWVYERLTEVSVAPFEACLTQAGTFGRRVVWAGVEGVDELQQALAKALAPRFESDRFHSHITLARPKNVKKGIPITHALDRVDIRRLCFTVDRFTLYESKLSSEGPTYRVIERFSSE